MSLQVPYTVEVKKYKSITMKVKRRKPDPGKDQTVRQTHQEPGEAAHCKVIDLPVVLYRQVQSVQKKPWKVIKLQFTDKVVDISMDVEEVSADGAENRRRCISIAERRIRRCASFSQFSYLKVPATWKFT